MIDPFIPEIHPGGGELGGMGMGIHLIAEEEHDGAWVVQLVHGVEVRHGVNVYLCGPMMSQHPRGHTAGCMDLIPFCSQKHSTLST